MSGGRAAAPPPAERVAHYDVAVIGGGSAGVAAAAGAAASGARTLLVERYGMLGGAATISSVLTYCGFFTQGAPWNAVVGGVGADVLARLAKLEACAERVSASSQNKFVVLDPEAVKRVLDEVVADSGADLLLHTRAVAADSDGGRVSSVTVVDHGGPLRITADAFVDASGDGNLSHLAGAGTRAPAPGEEFQSGTMMMRLGGVSPEADLGREAVRAAVRSYRDGTGYPLTNEGGIVARLPISGDVIAILADEPVNGLDSASLTAAERSGRAQAWGYLEAFRRHLPGAEHAFLSQTGPQLGVREGRRLRGRYSMTREDVVTGRRRPDAVARCGWPIEAHPGPGKKYYESVGGSGFYDIGYDALLAADRENLWGAGRLTSADRDAFSSLRVMGTAFATGHAAGVAAAHWADTRRHDSTGVRARLTEQDALV